MSLIIDGQYVLTEDVEATLATVEDIARNGIGVENYLQLMGSGLDLELGIDQRKLSYVNQPLPDTGLEAIASIMQLLPTTYAEEENGEITICGIPTKLLVSRIYKLWNTSRVTKNIINKQAMRYFTFYSFFAVEVVYLLKEVLKLRNVSGSKPTIRKAIAAIEDSTRLKQTKSLTYPKRFDYSKLNELNVNLLPHQREYLETYEEATHKYSLDGYVLAAAPGTGKALKNGTPVLTPTGWTPIEKLSVGDYVISVNGTPTRVEGVYHHTDLVLHRLTFEDGRTVECCSEHLWTVQIGNESNWVTLNTIELFNRMGVQGLTIKIPNMLPWTGKYAVNDAYGVGLRAAGQGIPKTYLDAREGDRKLLWHGLLNSKLVKSHSGSKIVFVAHSNASGDDLVYLARSFGYTAERIGGDVYVDAKRRPIELVEIASSGIAGEGRADATCIAVSDHRKLFVTNDFIVTHNTITGYAMALVSESDIDVFIVPNNAVEDVWEDTIHKRFKHPERYPYWTSHQKGEFTGKERFLIIHYDYLIKFSKQLNKLRNRKVGIWVDESHNFNDINSERTKLLVRLTKELDTVTYTSASGTPWKATGKEVVPTMRIVAKDFTPEVEERFVKIFGASKGAALEMLANRLGMVQYIVEKTDVSKVERNVYTLPVEFKGSEIYTLDAIRDVVSKFILERKNHYSSKKREYELRFNALMVTAESLMTNKELTEFKLYQQGVSKLHVSFDPKADAELVKSCKVFERTVLIPKLSNADKKEFRHVSSVYKYVSLVIIGEALGRILTRARIDCFKAMVPHTRLEDVVKSARKKTLIFTSYVEVADAIRDDLKSKGFEPLMVYGSTNSNLNGILSEFKNNPNANPIIATFDSLSTAVDSLALSATTLVMYNSPFRQYIREQTIARLDRIGQDSDVIDIVDVVLDTGEQSNISSRSVDILQWSKDNVDKMMGIKSEVGDYTGVESYGQESINAKTLSLLKSLGKEL